MVLETREIGGADPEERQQQNNQIGHDFKLEYCKYRDEEGEYARACLDYPFPSAFLMSQEAGSAG